MNTTRTAITRPPTSDGVVTAEAVEFLTDLHDTFDASRRELLELRADRRARLRTGETLDFLLETSEIRSSEWTVAPPPIDLVERRVEITGPTDRKMMINALNSGASVFMADCEDATSPTWQNIVDGQANLIDAARGRIRLETPDRIYQLDENPATLMVRPRGWHLDEKHIEVDGVPMSASLVDFGLYLFHNGMALVERGSGAYLYLPKLEGHLEARLWNDVFVWTERKLALASGAIRATVLIETILAAFEMDEILYELREHSAGLNAGRWDYIFSVIKQFAHQKDMVLPDRAQVTMAVPFMHSYAELLVRTCHRREAHAIGGMAAFIPSRKDAKVNEAALTAVRADKRREAEQGFDGTWVAHPDLVPVARAEFDEALGESPHQLGLKRGEVTVEAEALLDTRIAGGRVTEEGIRTNIRVGLLYIASWLGGTGAVALFHLMEDAATAEISRSQIWQWVHHNVSLDDGRTVTTELVGQLIEEELEGISVLVGADAFAQGRFDEARLLFEEVALTDPFIEFLTLRAYELID